MTLEQSRKLYADRISEIRSVYAHISALESSLGLTEPTTELLSLRGLFFVHLYGAFEFAVNSGVQEFLRRILATEVKFSHLTSIAYVYSLDGKFDSIAAANGKKVFKKRAEFVAKQFSADKVDMPDTIFSMSLQNIGAADFENVFEWLGLTSPAFPVTLISQRGYLDEIVEKRRKVAHGREGASLVGQGTRSPDLLKRIEAVGQCVEHLFSALEAHLSERLFVALAHRPAYA